MSQFKRRLSSSIVALNAASLERIRKICLGSWRRAEGPWRFPKSSAIASGVESLFFPRSATLGLEVDYDYSPGLLEKLVYAGVNANSFDLATKDLRVLAEFEITTERVRRSTERVGRERVAERDQLVAAYEDLPLPQRQQSPVEQAPEVACVQMDGGRMQRRDRHQSRTEQHDDREGFWREVKVGCLMSMTSQVSPADPCPELPPTFVDPGRMREIAREIKGFSSETESSPEAQQPPDLPMPARAGQPQPLVKSVVATCGTVDKFGPHLTAAAYQRGFHAATRKAFVADGSETNWGVWRKHFSHYTPILDFVHALTYVYAGALAGQSTGDGWSTYRRWAQWVWSGEVAQVIAALKQRQAELGVPTKDEAGTPRSQVAETLRYLTNQQSRMHYADYRRQGLPITSSYIESTVKQVNRRMKGTEKFWSTGAEAMVTLVADYLSETTSLAKFWQARPLRQNGMRCYQNAA